MHSVVGVVVESLKELTHQKIQNWPFCPLEYDIIAIICTKLKQELYSLNYLSDESWLEFSLLKDESFGTNLGLDLKLTDHSRLLLGFLSEERLYHYFKQNHSHLFDENHVYISYFCFNGQKRLRMETPLAIKWLNLLYLLDKVIEQNPNSKEKVLNSLSSSFLDKKLQAKKNTNARQRQYYIKNRSLKFSLNEQKILADEILKVYLTKHLGLGLKKTFSRPGFQSKYPYPSLRRVLEVDFPKDSKAFYLNNLFEDQPQNSKLDSSGRSLYEAGRELIGLEEFNEVLRNSPFSLARRLLLLNAENKSDLVLGALDSDPKNRLGAEILLKEKS